MMSGSQTTNRSIIFTISAMMLLVVTLIGLLFGEFLIVLACVGLMQSYMS